MAARTGRRHLVLLASFLTLLLNTSMNYAVGVIHVELLRHFRGDVITTAWVGALFGCMFSLAGPVASAVIARWDCSVAVAAGAVLTLLGFSTSCLVSDVRLLFLTYSLLAGVGQVLTHGGAMVVLADHFPDHLSLAGGVANTGAGLGVFLHPTLTQLLIDNYSIRGTFLLLGAISLHALPCALLMRRGPGGTARRRGGRGLACCCGPWCRLPVLRRSDLPLLLALLAVLGLALAASAIFLHLPRYFQQQGASPEAAALALSVAGLGGTVSRLLLGAAASHTAFDPLTLVFACVGITGLVTLALPRLSVSAGGRYLYGLLLGVYTGGCWSLQLPIASRLAGPEGVAGVFGLLMMATGLGYLVGPPLAGLCAEYSGNYGDVFLFSSCSLMLGSVCALLSAACLSTGPAPEADAIECSDAPQVTAPFLEERSGDTVVLPSRSLAQREDVGAQAEDSLGRTKERLIQPINSAVESKEGFAQSRDTLAYPREDMPRHENSLTQPGDGVIPPENGLIKSRNSLVGLGNSLEPEEGLAQSGDSPAQSRDSLARAGDSSAQSRDSLARAGDSSAQSRDSLARAGDSLALSGDSPAQSDDSLTPK